MKKTLILSISLLGCLAFLKAQVPSTTQDTEIEVPALTDMPSVHLKETNETIILDGEMNESSWFQGINADKFWMQFPNDSTQAAGHTEIYMTYDEEHLYVAVKCYTIDNNYIVPSLRRDYSFRNSDNISILFDTYNDKTNAFLFGLNPYGVRREALISGGGKQFSDFQSSWDNKWEGTSKIHDGYWIAEFSIPFKTLRFKEGSTHWRFNSYRYDTQINEISSWIHIPRNQLIMDLAYMGNMVWDEPLKKPGKNISIIPYVNGNASRDYLDEDESKVQLEANFGGDAKIALTSGLNLDLTVNPDFSQVEVDRQVTNLTRFEVFFPERRQFFLENADLFGSFGLSRVNPFFSRRIGVAQDTATGSNIQNTILYGARLSGKVNENFRVGLLNMQTAKDEAGGIPAFNYSVAALQHKVFDRSNISFLFVNKQALDNQDTTGLFNDYNRVAGIEYRLASADNRLTGKTYYYHAFTPENESEKGSHALQLEYNRRNYRLEWAHLYVGNGFNAEVGFVPRKDFWLFSPEGQYFFYPKKGKITRHGPGFDYRVFLRVGADGNEFRNDLARSDQGLEVFWNFDFLSSAEANILVENQYVFLTEDFDPTREQEDGVFLPAGTDYSYTSLSLSFDSDSRRKFSYNLEPTIGQFFNGFRAGIRGRLSYRIQPFGSVSLNANYDYVKLDDPFKAASIFLVGPRFDLTFTKKIFLTTFVQYNSQFDNVNLNARFQWRFQPVSDFFLVYTDNYFPNGWESKSRAVVMKVTYWLNL